MMAKDPAARQQSMTEVIADLQGRKAGLPRWVVVAAGIVLAAIIVGVALVLLALTSSVESLVRTPWPLPKARRDAGVNDYLDSAG
jgi:hypothetical protein